LSFNLYTRINQHTIILQYQSIMILTTYLPSSVFYIFMFFILLASILSSQIEEHRSAFLVRFDDD